MENDDFFVSETPEAEPYFQAAAKQPDYEITFEKIQPSTYPMEKETLTPTLLEKLEDMSQGYQQTSSPKRRKVKFQVHKEETSSSPSTIGGPMGPSANTTNSSLSSPKVGGGRPAPVISTWDQARCQVANSSARYPNPWLALTIFFGMLLVFMGAGIGIGYAIPRQNQLKEKDFY